MRHKIKQDNELFLYKPTTPVPGAAKVLFCFPGDYHIAMSSLGYMSIFKWLDESQYINVERVYGNSKNINTHQADIICFSMTFELAFAKIFEMIETMGIHLYSKDRSEDEPLVIAGGPGIAANPEPFADFFDIVLIGDAENLLVEFIYEYKAFPVTMSKKEKLVELSKRQGVYVPSLYHVTYKEDDTIQSIEPINPSVPNIIEKNYDTRLNEFTYTPILVPESVFGNKFIVEVVRGCNKRCRFCLASYLTLPTRYYDLPKLQTIIHYGLQYTNHLALLGALVTEHPHFNELCHFLDQQNKKTPLTLSVSSLRVDSLNDQLAKLLADCHLDQITLAIEAGSDRLKKIINKQLQNEQIFEAFNIANKNGLKAIKLYGMIGLPYETDQDIEELIQLLLDLKTDHKNLKIILGLSSFVPKAHTPFQWVKLASDHHLTHRLKRIEKTLSRAIDFRKPSLKWDFYQALVARGDRRLAPLLERVYRFGCTLGSWRRAFNELKEENISIPELNWYVKRERIKEECLPWHHLNESISTEQMYKELELSIKKATES